MDWVTRNWPGGTSDTGAIKTMESTVQCYTTGILAVARGYQAKGIGPMITYLKMASGATMVESSQGEEL